MPAYVQAPPKRRLNGSSPEFTGVIFSGKSREKDVLVYQRHGAALLQVAVGENVMGLVANAAKISGGLEQLPIPLTSDPEIDRWLSDPKKLPIPQTVYGLIS